MKFPPSLPLEPPAPCKIVFLVNKRRRNLQIIKWKKKKSYRA
jgi:hypothetical protein